MADTKISGLPASTTPLAGTEVLPIVQSGVTKQVSVADLTMGRSVGSAGGTFTDNFTQGVAGKGVNFAANSNAAGMTSELLNWYEEGTWTPTMTSASGTTTVNSSSGLYTRIGQCVYIQWKINYTTDGTVGTSTFTIDGLPFTSNANQTARGFVALSNWTGADYNDGVIYANTSATTLAWASRAIDQSSRTNAQLSFSGSYFV